MNEALVRGVKNSLNKQHYTMNDSWLSECIEYYFSEHSNASQEEIITFVMNQWALYDLREINNEKGCLPRGLAQQKCTTLPGKYILQMDKIYDISQSKYKQLEKIRNVSIENVEATERENTQDDKFQNFEPKSKRMLQLFLTDGVQDVIAIEYNPIRFLKDTLFPGFKVMIKGPVICRKGVILLEETNIMGISGEVDSLLITNAVENVFARALNLEENPDPYNDNKKTQNNQTQSTQATIQTDDEFDIDSQVLDQIDKQINQQTSGISKNTSSSLRYTPSQTSEVNISNCHQRQNSSTLKKTENLNTPGSRSQQSLGTTVDKNKTPQQKYNNANKERLIQFEDDGDSFLEMVDDNAFQSIPVSKPTFKIPPLPTPLSNKFSNLPKATPNSIVDDFPTDDEMYHLTDSFTTSIKSKSQSTTNLSNIAPCSSISASKNNTSKENKNNTLKSVSNQISSKGGNNNLPEKLYTTKKFSIPDDDFDLGDVNMETDDFYDYFNKNEVSTNTEKSNQLSISLSKSKESKINNDCLSRGSKNSASSKHSSSETNFGIENDSLPKMDMEFNDEFDIEFEAIENKDFKSCIDQQADSKKFKVTDTKNLPVKAKNQSQSNFSEQFGNKRSRDATSSTSSSEDIPQKVPRLSGTPKSNKSNGRKITDFLTSPTNPASSTKNKQSPLLTEDGIKCCEFLKDSLKLCKKMDSARIIVRGKVKNVVKLNLLKNEKGQYFHLEGTISDDTANLDVVFSSEILEKIIGYSTQEFSQKRKQSKTDPSIKDQLREDLKKAQQKLIVMDELMEIQLKKNEKAVILNSIKLTKEQKKSIDDRVKLINAR
ncbi:uncharacterized protein LOC106640646 [Copidosoma floridanum]|uniref:uncharacterized protein LOC106640646 n=1 Tax=Copidosoma floridanum TaxID=29053 RepID=UPI0006C9826F|nr:uncharacterized protein LOC106640646 [Copidosoma floridanum]